MSESWASGPPEQGVVLTDADEKEIDANVDADFWHTGEHFRGWLMDTEEAEARRDLLTVGVQYAARFVGMGFKERSPTEQLFVEGAEQLLSDFRDDCRDDFVMEYVEMIEDQIRMKDDQGEDE